MDLLQKLFGIDGVAAPLTKLHDEMAGRSFVCFPTDEDRTLGD
jgi:hypothetical protein